MIIGSDTLSRELHGMLAGLASNTVEPASQAAVLDAACTLAAELRRRHDVAALDDITQSGYDLAKRLGTEIPAGSPAGAEAVRAHLATWLARSGDGRLDPTVATELLRWEADLGALPEPAVRQQTMAEDMSRKLAVSMSRQSPVWQGRVVSCTQMHGGFGKTTHLAEIETATGTTEVVVRSMRPTMLLDLPSQQVDREFYLCSYLFRHGIRVPEPLWLETDPDVTALPFMVCRRMPGDIFGTAVSATPVSGVQVRDMAFELARIHAVGRGDADDENLRRSAIDPDQFDATLSDVVREYIDSWHRIWRGLELEPNPGVEATLMWLDEAMPAVDDSPVFLHGDYALHNVLLESDGISAVLDWELSRVGDRAEELSWLFSATSGSIDPGEFMAAYVEAGGRPVDEFRLRYYEVLSHLKLLVVCLESQLRFEQLSEPEPAYCRFGLGLVQHPMQALAGAIERAEVARPK